MPYLTHLRPEERLTLREMARQFIAEKQWSAADGFELTPAMQISISLQACLLVLKLGLEWYRGWIGIILYPGEFLVPRRIVDENGVMHEYTDQLMGEAWADGPVVLSWSGHAGGRGTANVVLHEFAHKLDMLNGPADGLPPLHRGMSKERWHEAFEEAWEDLCDRVDAGEETALDPYAAEHPAEFFAVASEAFFTHADVLRRAYPRVHEQLRLFYRQDPCAAS